MWKYILKRILYLIPVFIVVSFLVFWLMTYTGDPAAVLGGENMTQEEIAALREQMGLNKSIWVRYAEYVNTLLHGSMGTSLYKKDVWQEFIQRLPYTCELAVAAMIVTVVFAVPFGIIAAIKQNTWVDSTLSAIAMAGISIPSFWLGLMLILAFAVKIRIFPTFGADAGFRSIVLPAITAGVSNASVVARMSRSSMVDNLRADFLRTARAKGVSEKRVYLKHALGNALIPIVTMIGSQFSGLLGGTVAVETIFSWPGLGKLMVESIRCSDYMMVTGFVLGEVVLVALVLLAVDIVYAYIDPRIKARYTGK